jgi:tetratricopeptide (TPR) repeat protein
LSKEPTTILRRIKENLVSRLSWFTLSVLCAVGNAAAQNDRPDRLPMFGQPKIVRPDDLKQADEDFIRDAIFKYGNRPAASNALAAQGWAALRGGQVDLALLRFNQSWLLNPKNYGAFWGFGAVLSERANLADAIEQLERARELNDDPVQRVALLSDLGAVHSEYATRVTADKQLERAQHFVIANYRFTESLELNPNYAASWREWALSLYAQERYSEAWIKANRAVELKAEPFPVDFLKRLREKMAQPKP